MPRKAGASTPKYRKHRASGQAVVTIAGRDCYLGPYGSNASQLEYDRRIGEWLSAGRPTVAVVVNDLTIAELCQAYKRYTDAYYRRGGMHANIATAMRAFRAFPPAQELEGIELKRWRSDHRWSRNRLRHTAATEIRKRFGLESAQVVLGHSRPNTTLIRRQLRACHDRGQ